MKAKLIKERFDFYGLKVDDKIIATNDVEINKMFNYPYTLSLKNCEAIENGYDLDELALEAFELDLNCQGDCNNYYERLAYKLGMIKMIKLLGDKKFSEEQMRMAYGRQFDCSFPDFLQSLQQNEWEVEVEMEPVFDIEYSNNGYRTEKFNKTEYRPKLDADRCIILKRV